MTDLEKAIALIAFAEQTYFENYYGDNISIFNRTQTSTGITTGEQCSDTSSGE